MDSILPCDYAKEMQAKYSDILSKYTLEQIEEVWSSYSEESCASWLIDDRDTVAIVFSQADNYFEYKKEHPTDDVDNYAGQYYNWKNYYFVDKRKVK